MVRQRLYLIFYSFITTSLFSQGIPSSEGPLYKILNDISNEYKIEITYDLSLVERFYVNIPETFSSPGSDLRETLYNTNLGFLCLGPQKYIIIDIRRLSKDISSLIQLNLDWTEINSQDSYKAPPEDLVFQVSGMISDATQQTPLAGATIVLDGTNQSVVSDQNGNFVISVPAGKSTLNIHALGYATSREELVVTKNQEVIIEMFEETKELDELIIYAEKFSDKVTEEASGLEAVNIRSIKEFPAFMGEVDVIQSISTLPGVSSAGEATNGFNVRGGKNDENLVTLDGISLYNTSHLFGLLSIINGDIVNDFTLYKGGTSAVYGGRSSSILTINTRDGDMDKISSTINLGTVTSSAIAEGPLKRGKSNYLVSARFGYPNWILGKVDNPSISNSLANFKDVVFKFSQKNNNGTKLTFTGLYGSDNFSFTRDTSFYWDTFGAALNYHIYKDINTSHKITLSSSNYIGRISGDYPQSEFLYRNKIYTQGIKVHTIKTSDENYWDYGTELNFYNLYSGELSATNAESSINNFEPAPDKSIEIAGFISTERRLSPQLKGTLGIRVSGFFPKGNTTEYLYEDELKPTNSTVTDTLLHKRFSFFSPYLGIEPRLNFIYQLNTFSSIKGGYQLMRQNIHIISNSLSIAPNDYWKLSNSYIRPRITHQANIGYFRNFKHFFAYAELFYRKSFNVLELQPGTSVFVNPNLETSLINTKGKSYGGEFKLEKRGKLNGWISYSYIQALRYFDEGHPLDDQSSQHSFETDYNRPHNFNLLANYKLSRRVSISASFIFNSGRPFTFARSVYTFNRHLITQYSNRNEGQIPSYHRLDLSFIIKGNLKKEKFFDGDFSINFFNLYSRKNAYSVFYSTTDSGLIPRAYKLSILGSVFPSVSYKFKLSPNK